MLKCYLSRSYTDSTLRERLCGSPVEKFSYSLLIFVSEGLRYKGIDSRSLVVVEFYHYYCHLRELGFYFELFSFSFISLSISIVVSFYTINIFYTKGSVIE